MQTSHCRTARCKCTHVCVVPYENVFSCVPTLCPLGSSPLTQAVANPVWPSCAGAAGSEKRVGWAVTGIPPMGKGLAPGIQHTRCRRRLHKQQQLSPPPVAASASPAGRAKAAAVIVTCVRCLNHPSLNAGVGFLLRPMTHSADLCFVKAAAAVAASGEPPGKRRRMNSLCAEAGVKPESTELCQA